MTPCKRVRAGIDEGRKKGGEEERRSGRKSDPPMQSLRWPAEEINSRGTHARVEGSDQNRRRQKRTLEGRKEGGKN